MSDEGNTSFAADVRPLFRDKDVESMKRAGFDLSSYDDVKPRAQKILDKLAAGQMPCDGRWSEPEIATFRRWMDGGMLP
jgi:hypothetical protein